MADSGNIIAATLAESGGAVYVAPLGTTVPTDATTALPAAWKDLGWVSEDGFTNSAKRNTTKHKSFGGETVKVTQDDFEETFTFALLETSAQVLKVVYGEDNVEESDGTITVKHSSLMLPRQMFVIDFIDGDRVGRHIILEGQITEVGDIKYVHKDLTMYELTVDTFRPAGETAGVITMIGGGSADTGGAFAAKRVKAPVAS